ncbi:ABC transporter ATP-binding protein [Streptococcus dentiloxodontae]
MIEVRDLTVSFGQFKALKQINLSISEKAGVIGLIGPNGAGKTTLIHTIFGQLKKAKGKICLPSKDIAYCPDTPSFEGCLKPDEVLEQSLALYGKKIDTGKIAELLNFVGLNQAHMSSYVGDFSRGMKQRLGIASVLILEPQIVFLDEPTSALDPFGREDMLSLIEEISKNCTVVVSSHLLKDIQTIADSLIVLDKGRLLYQGDLTPFLQQSYQYAEVEVRKKEDTAAVYQFLLQNGISAEILEEKPRTVIFPQEQSTACLLHLDGIADKIVSFRENPYDLTQAFKDCVAKAEKGGAR